MIFAIVNESADEHVYIAQGGHNVVRCDPSNKTQMTTSAGFISLEDEWKPREVRLFEAYSKYALPQGVQTAIGRFYLKIAAVNFITDADEPPYFPDARDGSWAYKIWKEMQALELKVADLLAGKIAVIQFMHEHRCWRISLGMDRAPVAGESIAIGKWVLSVNFVTHMPAMKSCAVLATVVVAPPNDTPTAMGEPVKSVTEIKDPHDRIQFSMSMRMTEEK